MLCLNNQGLQCTACLCTCAGASSCASGRAADTWPKKTHCHGCCCKTHSTRHSVAAGCCCCCSCCCYKVVALVLTGRPPLTAAGPSSLPLYPSPTKLNPATTRHWPVGAFTPVQLPYSSFWKLIPVSITHTRLPDPSRLAPPRVRAAPSALLRPVAAALPSVADAVLARAGWEARCTDDIVTLPGRMGSTKRRAPCRNNRNTAYAILH
jgi:hypothetical protein